MTTHRVLVVHYSRTGCTRELAVALAALLGADLEPIEDVVDRSGLCGYLRSGAEASLGASTEIRRGRDPSRYDLVVVGSPVWRLSVSSPVRTYLWLERPRLPRVAFFVTMGGMGSARALRQMAEIAVKGPVATLALRARELAGQGWRAPAQRFAASALSALERPSTSSGRAEKAGRRSTGAGRPGRAGRPPTSSGRTEKAGRRSTGSGRPAKPARPGRAA